MIFDNFNKKYRKYNIEIITPKSKLNVRKYLQLKTLLFLWKNSK